MARRDPNLEFLRDWARQFVGVTESGAMYASSGTGLAVSKPAGGARFYGLFEADSHKDEMKRLFASLDKMASEPIVASFQIVAGDLIEKLPQRCEVLVGDDTMELQLSTCFSGVAVDAKIIHDALECLRWDESDALDVVVRRLGDGFTVSLDCEFWSIIVASLKHPDLSERPQCIGVGECAGECAPRWTVSGGPN